MIQFSFMPSVCVGVSAYFSTTFCFSSFLPIEGLHICCHGYGMHMGKWISFSFFSVHKYEKDHFGIDLFTFCYSFVNIFFIHRYYSALFLFVFGLNKRKMFNCVVRLTMAKSTIEFLYRQIWCEALFLSSHFGGSETILNINSPFPKRSITFV